MVAVSSRNVYSCPETSCGHKDAVNSVCARNISIDKNYNLNKNQPIYKLVHDVVKLNCAARTVARGGPELGSVSYSKLHNHQFQISDHSGHVHICLGTKSNCSVWLVSALLKGRGISYLNFSHFQSSKLNVVHLPVCTADYSNWAVWMIKVLVTRFVPVQ